MVLFFSERCVVLQGRKQFRWAGWNCGYQKDGQTLFKALCQKESFQKLETTTTPQSPTNSDIDIHEPLGIYSLEEARNPHF